MARSDSHFVLGDYRLQWKAGWAFEIDDSREEGLKLFVFCYSVLRWCQHSFLTTVPKCRRHFRAHTMHALWWATDRNQCKIQVFFFAAVWLSGFPVVSTSWFLVNLKIRFVALPASPLERTLHSLSLNMYWVLLVKQHLIRSNPNMKYDSIGSLGSLRKIFKTRFFLCKN